MDDAAVVPARHKLDVGSYHRMIDAGILGKDDRVELVNGDILEMAPIGQVHEAVVNGLAEALFRVCVGRAIVSAQNSIRLDQWSALQPDLAVLRRRADFYATGERAGPADVLLLVEVADTSLRFDRMVKLPLYARAGIAEMWIVDVTRRGLNAYRTPAGDEYRDTATYSAGDRLALALDPEIVVTLDLMFG